MKTVVITGSARGFGFEMARCFRRANYNIMLSDLNIDDLKRAKAELENEVSQAKVHLAVCNVTDFAQLENLYNEAEKTFGGVQIRI